MNITAPAINATTAATLWAARKKVKIKKEKLKSAESIRNDI